MDNEVKYFMGEKGPEPIGVLSQKDYWADDGGGNSGAGPGTFMIDLITGPIWGWVTNP